MAWPKGVTRKEWNSRKLVGEASKTMAKSMEKTTLFDGRFAVPEDPKPYKAVSYAFSVENKGNLYQLVRYSIHDGKIISRHGFEETTRLDALQAFQRHTFNAFWEDRNDDVLYDTYST